MKAALFLALPFVVACACPTNTSCPGNLFQQVAAQVSPYIASKIPLNTQSACAGTSSVPLQTDPQAITPPPSACTPDPSDTTCGACLRAACCEAYEQACLTDGGALGVATCASEPTFKGCILGALAESCAAACGGAS